MRRFGNLKVGLVFGFLLISPHCIVVPCSKNKKQKNKQKQSKKKSGSQTLIQKK